MTKIIVTGGEFELSPIRVATRSLSVGRLQLLRLASKSILDGLQGPLLSQAARLQTTELTRKPYPLATIAMSPPLVLQTRGASSAVDDPAAGHCTEGTVLQRIQSGLARAEQQKCSFPHSCDLGSSLAATSRLCTRTIDDVPETFFGREPVLYEGGPVFAEFPWVLENSNVVRNGTAFAPADEFVDAHTTKITCLVSFYTIPTKIATVLQVNFDLSRVRVDTQVYFMQVRVQSWDEFWAWCSLTIAAMVCIAMFGIQAVPAAIEELRGSLTTIVSWLDPKGNFIFLGKSRQARYTADTQQPDALDVLLSLGLLGFLSFSIAQTVHKVSYADDIFGTMAEIDWSDGDVLFTEKVLEFLGQLQNAMALTRDEEFLLTWVFWLLIICAIRIIIFMGIHPHIAGVYLTFKMVAMELLNFLFTFGIIFMFLAFLAHIRFGFKYDGFRTIQESMITQFSILIGDDTPDYNNDVLMTLYVVGYVFICTMALLNFLLAIVVNGYTRVTEQAQKNTVVLSLASDLAIAFTDVIRWKRHRQWPSKRRLLIAIADEHPSVMEPAPEDGGSDGRPPLSITAEELQLLMQRHGQTVPFPDMEELFQYYCRLKFLLFQEEPKGEVKSPCTPGQPAHMSAVL